MGSGTLEIMEWFRKLGVSGENMTPFKREWGSGLDWLSHASVYDMLAYLW